MSDTPLKSAFELAMDRLKAKDVAEGVAEATPLTKAQKTRITELRAEAQAKLAELEILHRKNVAGTSDPAAIRYRPGWPMPASAPRCVGM